MPKSGLQGYQDQLGRGPAPCIAQIKDHQSSKFLLHYYWLPEPATLFTMVVKAFQFSFKI